MNNITNNQRDIKSFIAAIGGYDYQVTIQTFSEKNKTNHHLSKILHGNIDKHLSQLFKLNGNGGVH